MNLGTAITTLIFFGILYLIWRLSKIKGVVLDDIGIDNPYNKTSSMPLKKYEEELDKAFDYSKVKITPLFEDDESNNISYREENMDLVGNKIEVEER